MTKVIRIGLLVGLVLIVVSCVCIYTAFARDAVPEGVEIFQLPDQGLTCVVWPDGSGDCYCPCFDECNLPPITPTEPPSDVTPTPVPSDTPEPTEKPKCNRGLGNNEEGCDPGNSGGKPGAAGEDNEPSGPPGRNK
jgi:hypothetical protein